MVLKHLFLPVSIQSGKVTFCLLTSLCSSDDVYRPISSPYISTCIACCALLFGPIMNLPIYYKPCRKRNSFMQIIRVITVLPFSRPYFHRVQCKIDDPFSPGRFAPIPLTTYVGINDLRIRIYLKHRRCFPLPFTSVKPFI